MAVQKLTLKLVGVSPLILHSGRLADPNYWASKELKRLSSKRSKTEADLHEMAKIEFLGSLYLDQDKRVILPDTVLESAFVAGAKRMKLGQSAKAGLFVAEHALVDYGKHLSPEGLWEQEEFRLYVPVKVTTSKVMRMRPIFREWSATVFVEYLDDLLSEQDVIRIAEHAGMQAGVGDWRPKHGRFTVEKVGNMFS